MKMPLHIPEHRASRHRGFTLAELLISIAISGVLLAVALPSLGSAMSSSRLNSASADFFSALLLARSEAIKRGANVTVCKSADGVVCSPSGGWEQGWVVFGDTNEDGLHDPAETVILRGAALDGKVRLTGNLNVARYITFTAAGATQLTSGAFQAGTLTFCRESSTAGPARQIILSAAGRPRLHKLTVQTC
ncbi:MAG: GspH/FimT family pseudopilin [Pseudomonadota bacterium]